MEHVKQKRVTIYIPEDKYKVLRAKLIMMGLTLSGWIRIKMDQLLKNED